MPSDHEQRRGRTLRGRKKKRKSRSERNKLITHRDHSKDKKSADPMLKQDVRRHLSRAEDVSMHQRTERNIKEKSAFAVITQNRLTRGVGIFNKGKKSDTILRGSLPIPEKTKLKTAEEMRKILDLSDAGLNQVAKLDSLDQHLEDRDKEVIMDWQESDTLPRDRSYPELDLHHRGAAARSPSTLRSHSAIPPASCCPEMDAVMEIEENPGKTESPDEMPQEIPFQEIAKRLISCVDVTSTFPGRDYLLETRDKLQKTMKRSMMHTPPNEICLTKTSDGIVKRSLQQSIDNQAAANEGMSSQFPKPKSMECEHSKPIPRSACATSAVGNEVHNIPPESKNITHREAHNSNGTLQKCEKDCEKMQSGYHDNLCLSPWQQTQELNHGGLPSKGHSEAEHFKILNKPQPTRFISEFFPCNGSNNMNWPSAAAVDCSESFAWHDTGRDLLDDIEQGQSGYLVHNHRYHTEYQQSILRPYLDSDTDSTPVYAQVLPLPQKPASGTPTPDKLYRPMRMF